MHGADDELRRNMTNKWVFDAIPASGKLEGGNLASYVFNPSIDTLVRESLQNSNDQPIGDAPVEVSYELSSLTGDSKKRLLQAIGWETLTPHLKSVADADNLVAGRIGSILSNLSEPLRILVIRDRQANGLFGGEDAADGNFAPLCKHVLITPEAKALGGGSHGLGKAVYWTFSGISSVSFSSVPFHKDDPKSLRYISRAELPYHFLEAGAGDKEGWTGSGWHGAIEDRGRGPRARSVRGPEAESLLRGTQLFRNLSEYGTSILIPFFFEPEQEEPRPLDEIADDLILSVNRWFWPSLITNHLAVTVTWTDDNGKVITKRAAGDKMDAPFKQAWSNPCTGISAFEAGELAEQEIPFLPPQRKPGLELQGSYSGNLQLRVRRALGTEAAHELIDSIALIRGAYMVVKYFRPTLPLEARGFFGVLKVGTAFGQSDVDKAIELFFTASEPPEHNDWIPSTNNLASRYQPGARVRLRELWADIADRVKKICKNDVPYEGEGPDALKKLFPLGGDSAPKVPSYRVEFTSKSRVNGVVIVEASVTRNLNGCLAKQWEIFGALVLKGESGNGDALDLTSVVPDGSAGLEVDKKNGKSFSIRADKGLEEIQVRLTANENAKDLRVAARSMLLVKLAGREVSGI